ncbi:GAF domain-containing protein [Microscilla marina]|uniref:Two-component hybrid sensor and regulator, putative n=1 Tax=Microscilla marina ATCC 23134 TaxID=313606 RepID=A1ZTR8_MICM2|nr:GAF domain-containing protein [Microscilla marina]EAY26170.1 two-component hybrid sensor and regulator, putative [Microscilla marina ATCC 23134]
MKEQKYGLNTLFQRNSVIGRLFWLYVPLFWVFASGWYLITLRAQDQNKELTTIKNRHQDIQRNCQNLDIAVQTSIHLRKSRVLFKHTTNIDSIWSNRAETYLDSLSNISNKLDDKALKQKVKQVRGLMITLEKQFGRLNKFDFSALTTQNDGMFDDKKPTQASQDFEDIDRQINNLSINIHRTLNEAVVYHEVALKDRMALLKRKNLSNANYYAVFAFFILMAGIIISFIVLPRTISFVEELKQHINNLLHGKFPGKLRKSVYEMNDLVDKIDELTDSFRKLEVFAEEVGTGNFDTDIQVFDEEGDVGQSLAKMQNSLRQIAVANQQRNWFNEGFAKFGNILRNDEEQSFELFYESIITNLVKYLEVNQGGVFVLNEQGTTNKPVLELKASYAYNRTKYLKKELTKEDGLVGQAWREADVVYVTDIPYDYIELSSGLGGARPKSILIVPLLTGDDQLMGVVELASFDKFPEYKIDFVKQLSESIAGTISRVKTSIQNQQLLHESQQMAKQVRIRDKEKERTMKELITTKSHMEQANRELEAELNVINESFTVLELDADGNYTEANALIQKVSGYSRAELVGRHYTVLLRHKAGAVQKEWNSIVEGKLVKGEFVRYAKDGHKFWLYEIVYPVYNAKGELKKINSIGYEITKQKEQEGRINEQLQALQVNEEKVMKRIKEVRENANLKLKRLKEDFAKQIEEKDRIIDTLRG